LQFGLIAEEVERVSPELVIYGVDGQVETVAYQKLIPILLDELKRQREINKRQEVELKRLIALEDELREIRSLLIKN
jgi:hypothetical protein